MKYLVSVPIAGSATFEVEAADPRAAKAKVWDVINSGTEPDVEWEYFETICEGHVLHVSQNEVEVHEAHVRASGAMLRSSRTKRSRPGGEAEAEGVATSSSGLASTEPPGRPGGSPPEGGCRDLPRLADPTDQVNPHT